MVRSASILGLNLLAAAWSAPTAAAAPGPWETLIKNFVEARDALELACAKSLRDAMRPPMGTAPKPFRLKLDLASGSVVSLRVTESSGDPAVDQAAVDAVAEAVPRARCKDLDEITIAIPFR